MMGTEMMRRPRAGRSGMAETADGASGPRVLIVDDDPPLCELLRLSLAAKGFAATTRATAEAALSTLSSRDFDVLVTDLRLPQMDGLELCRRVTAERPDLPVVVITAFGNLDSAVAAIRAGAHDFIMKPVQMDEVGEVLERATMRRCGEDRLLGSPDELLGESAAMERTRDLVARAAASDAPVLIAGESGTGKELVARALHRTGRRASGPFVAINCAAVPEALLESELFGHVRGAFTDAKAARLGLFLQADGGTLFLDEIGEMSPLLQPKLLRALQERTVRPIGGATELPFDVRLIAATNVDLEAAVAERRFRGDLFFRLNVIPIEVPPLRDRQSDVVLLARRFAAEYAERQGKRISGLSPEALAKLEAYRWPGNVRELQNAVERAVALTAQPEIGVNDLPDPVRRAGFVSAPPVLLPETTDLPGLLPLAEVERRHIHQVLDAVHGNKRLAARVLGIDRRTLYRKLDQYEGRSPAPSRGPC
jgi:two-component system, NtrC family, response regulator AtoC